jgi:hypothetical protein
LRIPSNLGKEKKEVYLEELQSSPECQEKETEVGRGGR